MKKPKKTQKTKILMEMSCTTSEPAERAAWRSRSESCFFWFFLVFSMVFTCHLVGVLVFFEIFGFLDVYALSVTPRFLGWAGRLAIRCITILHCHGAGLETSPQGLCDLSPSPIWISGSICEIYISF